MHCEIPADHSLACRLERAEALAGARFVEARARAAPDSGAEWIEVAGTYAMYDGPRSPVTQTFGLGLFQTPTAADLDRLERFFQQRGAPAFHEVSPLADKSVPALLSDRNYRPVEFTSVLYLPLRGDIPGGRRDTDRIAVRVVADGEQDLWARTAAEGWREVIDFGDEMLGVMRTMAGRQDIVSFLAELDGRPIAAASLATHDGVALLAGASTIPEWRRRGAQKALLASRLDYARRAGCDLAMMCADPGSASQRNAERAGFRIAYTRIKWGLGGAGSPAASSSPA